MKSPILLKRFLSRIRSWVEKTNSSFEKKLEEGNYSEKEKEHIRWFNAYIGEFFLGGLIVMTVLTLLYGPIALLASPVLLAILIMDVLLKGKFDNWMLAAACFICTFLSLNMFFDDWKKTISIPLAYLSYKAGKMFCPNFIQGLFSVFENYVPLFGKLNTATKEAKEYIKECKKEQHHFISSPRPYKGRKSVCKKNNKRKIHKTRFLRRNPSQAPCVSNGGKKSL